MTTKRQKHSHTNYMKVECHEREEWMLYRQLEAVSNKTKFKERPKGIKRTGHLVS